MSKAEEEALTYGLGGASQGCTQAYLGKDLLSYFNVHDGPKADPSPQGTSATVFDLKVGTRNLPRYDVDTKTFHLKFHAEPTTVMHGTSPRLLFTFECKLNDICCVVREAFNAVHEVIDCKNI